MAPNNTDDNDNQPASRPDSFSGAWLVTEYVHDPVGSLIGTIKQRRTVEATTSGRLRVVQVCEPSDSLDGHPMAAFAGEWQFELEVHGDKRHYLGPDVVGVGTQWAPGAMTGEGVWPRFGHEFSSYGVLVNPGRQLTGGSFSRAGRSIADIVGVAVPESLGVEPELDLAAEPESLDELMVQRRIGPMRIGVRRLSPTTTKWMATMHDGHTNTNISITKVCTDDGAAEGSVSIA